MLAAMLLASLLAQAEPAPPEPPPPGPALPPDPGLPAEPVRPRANAVSVNARVAYRMGGDGGDNLGPTGGFALGGTFERRYLTVAGQLELGAAFDFGYQRFATDVVGTGSTAPGEPFDGQRIISRTNFALLQTVSVRAGRLRPFVGAGVGVGIGFFSTPEATLPASETVVQPIAEGTAGLDLDLGGNTALVVRADLIHPLTDPVFTAGDLAQRRYALFGDVIDAGLGLVVRF
jgi:opacity protein-like surface antigen